MTTHVMQGGMSDLLVFPILFAYRHWLELKLKSLITLGQRWRGEDIKPMHTHKLEVLWPLARAAIEAAFPDDPADLDTVGSIVHELVDVDPESMSFRYAHDRKGQVNLPAGLERAGVGERAPRALGLQPPDGLTGCFEAAGAGPRPAAAAGRRRLLALERRRRF